MMIKNNDKTRLITATNWPKHHPWPSINGLRHLIFNANKNGFSNVIRRVGRRILIDENSFFEWVQEQQGGREND